MPSPQPSLSARAITARLASSTVMPSRKRELTSVPGVLSATSWIGTAGSPLVSERMQGVEPSMPTWSWPAAMPCSILSMTGKLR